MSNTFKLGQTHWSRRGEAFRTYGPANWSWLNCFLLSTMSWK